MENKAVIQPYHVSDIKHLSNNVYRVILQPQEGIIPAFHAGQYLLMHPSENQSSAFSIASAPEPDQNSLELHIQRLPGKENSTTLFNQLHEGEIHISLPYGCCYLEYLPQKNLTFVAAGTGFAQMKSMVEYCLRENHQHNLNLYWGARSPDDYYLSKLPLQWQREGVNFYPVVSDAGEKDQWDGRHGLLYEALISDKEHLLNSEIYISGSPTMVYTTIDALLESGFQENLLYSDVFEYAPRS